MAGPTNTKLGVESPSLPSRLASLDIARGVAAIAVVLWHWQHFFQHGEQGFERSAQPLYAWLSIFYETSAHYAVTFFFVLSGFVFFWLYADSVASGRCDGRRFAVYRLARLYPLHFVTLLAVLVLQAIFFAKEKTFFVYQHNDAYHFALHSVLLSFWGFERGHSFNAPVWSVSIEIGLYAFFFALAFARCARWPVVAALICGLIAVQFAGIGGRWPLSLEAFLMGGLTFFAVRSSLELKGRSLLPGLVLAGIAPILWLGMAFSPQFSEFMLRTEPQHLYSRLLFPATIASFVVLEAWWRPNLSSLSWIGDISYSTYLIHFPLQILFVLIFSWLGLTNAAFYSPWALFAFFLVLIPMSLASFHLLERPAQKAIRKRLAPQTRSGSGR